MSQKIYETSMKDGFKINFTMIQNQSLKNQVTSIRRYDNEKHVKAVRSYLSKHNALPNSLSSKEVVYTGEIVIDSNQ